MTSKDVIGKLTGPSVPCVKRPGPINSSVCNLVVCDLNHCSESNHLVKIQIRPEKTKHYPLGVCLRVLLNLR